MEIFNFNILHAHMIGMFTTFCLCFFIILNKDKYEFLRQSHPVTTQKIHHYLAPRLAGLPIFIGLILQTFFIEEKLSYIFTLFLISAVPVFLLGFLEDINNNISPLLRLLGSILTGLLFVVLLNVHIENTGIKFINLFLSNYYISVFFTVLAIASLSQAFNIIDGLNGLSAITFVIILITIIILSHISNNNEIFRISKIIHPVIFAFLILNYPLGKIFLGDGGAYLLGTIISFLLIYLMQNNNAISPLSLFLIVIYPFYEVLRTFLRRMVFNKFQIAKPDLLHMHSLIYSNFLKKYKTKNYLKLNAFSCILTILFPLFSCLWALKWFNNFFMLTIGIILYITIAEICFYLLSRFVK